ncbi:MAG: Cu(I)-responsive transcriptional regulator [Hydrogenophaga sp.]|jgi:MerR family copper efflux transcriptional regulator|uniref:Cu(I)-responsive transcriptional regulator n=1 Tax=Hydrogenophaga sp. TaxID=1904254 RepID=UPI0025C0DD1B|nr:Cu(I)-responsive transcriptional regulator [Hydrogenophaga sp.]MDO9506438.1 Cu(I)-responsive transcriptional regulator [Hydrogenophaga sp.]MDP3204724.1 Cu(I)-responsive transcriptional regulator [Hydrogenophaga sp.]MDP3625583.1 Cu(I)-responsive transcriptional regulator [Hydrogenophaga sp.]
MKDIDIDQLTTWPVNIGKAAELSGISPKMLRHYETLGLLGGVVRTDSNYRQYSLADVHSLRFIRRSRDMGFGLDAIAELVSLWHNRKRSSATVKRITQKHLDELAQRIEALQAMQRTLGSLMNLCPGDGRPDCPILDDLAHSACTVETGTKLYKPATSTAPRRNTPRRD